MASNQSRFWRLVIAIQNKYRNGIFEAIREQINYFADSYKVGDVPGFLPTKQLTKVLRELHEEAGLNNALYMRKQIKRQIAKSEDNPENRLRWDLNEYFRQYLLQNAVLPITETTRRQINQVLLQGSAQGWGVRKMVAALKNTDITKQRAELIVRTESVKSANAGAMFAAADMGIVLNKQWISAQDNRTRRIPRDQYDHLHMNGKITGFADKFIVPSTKSIDAMDYPGDPSGSAGNVCNCRCTVAFIPVRDANGRAIPLSKTLIGPSPFTQIANEGSRLFVDNSLRLSMSLLIADLISEIESEE